ncbi:sulfurtransferase [Oceanobacillus kimchii]|uniref:Thiosulfate sulfurtransferase n=1 Tax=Oceanobacillus kimchii TaxID=746691 RepID=A0ABQ5TDP0_9BACI|nr:sulfurtransferase [Oceanobacillus kimchii]GLO64863.1 thiosulfate sulfurtransferase [Oceanobacillus kimchii]
MKNLISVQRLMRRFSQNHIVIVDVRFNLKDPDAGRKAYLKEHIPGAIYMDLNKDLSGKAGKHGGSHPLPDWDLFTNKLGQIGVTNETTVVVYDQGNDMFAPRFWWLMDYVGHDKVYILEGGLDQWKEEGGAVTTEVPSLNPVTYQPQLKQNRTVDMKEVRDKISNGNTILIDSRSYSRYLGDEEPLYRRAGHIPGAVNYFWKDVLTKDGRRWKDKEQLETLFANLSKDDEIIVSCGSGVSACPNILALETAGFHNVKLYPGSFSDWISYDDNDVKVGEEAP